MREWKKIFDPVIARERTLLDDVLDYLLDVDAKKLGKLTVADIEKKIRVDYYTLMRELPESPMIYLERVKAFRTILELSQQKKYREMSVEKLSRVLGFNTSANFQYIFRKYSGMPVETCQQKMEEKAIMILNEKRRRGTEKKQQARLLEKRRQERERRRQAREREKRANGKLGKLKRRQK